VRVSFPVANRVAAKLDRDLPRIANEASLPLEERMLATSCNDDERTAVANVLDVREPGCLAPGPLRLSDCQAIFLDKFLIDCARVFSLRNLAGDIKEIPTANIGHSKLLNEPGNTRRLTAIFRQSSTFGGTKLVEGLF
jgi:hypothetical protein